MLQTVAGRISALDAAYVALSEELNKTQLEASVLGNVKSLLKVCLGCFLFFLPFPHSVPSEATDQPVPGEDYGHVTDICAGSVADRLDAMSFESMRSSNALSRLAGIHTRVHGVFSPQMFSTCRDPYKSLESPAPGQQNMTGKDQQNDLRKSEKNGF